MPWRHSVSYKSRHCLAAALPSARPFPTLSAVRLSVCTLECAFRRRSLLVKFNFVEVAIVPGLVMADTGGSGDVSVLSASGRMHLMPFAAITNRIGGTLVLFLTSLMVPMLAL